MADLYPWLKALHIAAMVAWMAGLLYLPRLFVYHAEVAPDSEAGRLFEIMERRLHQGIMKPAMAATWLLGLALLYLQPIWLEMVWIYLKLALVLALSAADGFLGRCRRDFVERRNRRSARFFRLINELPAVALLLIAILVVVKPF